jgi:peptide deformylase
MKRVLIITQLGQSVLRKISKNVPLPLSKAHDRLIDDMIATMKKAKGVGIAAPQVGIGRRFFIVAPEPSVRYGRWDPRKYRGAFSAALGHATGTVDEGPKAPKMAPVAMINPVLVKHSTKMVTDWEGCLSIPGLRARVPRYQSVEVEFTTRDGRRLRGKLNGFVARIFQHEFDHINGMVYVDRVKDTRTFMTESEFRRRLTATLSRRERAQRSAG